MWDAGPEGRGLTREEDDVALSQQELAAHGVVHLALAPAGT